PQAGQHAIVLAFEEHGVVPTNHPGESFTGGRRALPARSREVFWPGRVRAAPGSYGAAMTGGRTRGADGGAEFDQRFGVVAVARRRPPGEEILGQRAVPRGIAVAAQAAGEAPDV